MIDLQSSVATYLARGGRIHRVPGFTGIKPMPDRRHGGSRSARTKPPPVMCRAESICRLAGCSIATFKNLLAAGHLPQPDSAGFNNQMLWNESVVPDMLLQIAVHTERLEGETWRADVAKAIDSLRKRQAAHP